MKIIHDLIQCLMSADIFVSQKFFNSKSGNVLVHNGVQKCVFH